MVVREDFQKKILKSKGERVGGRGKSNVGRGTGASYPVPSRSENNQCSRSPGSDEHGLGGQRRKCFKDKRVTWCPTLLMDEKQK